jgi:hypothetical protein
MSEPALGTRTRLASRTVGRDRLKRDILSLGGVVRHPSYGPNPICREFIPEWVH